MGDAYVLAENHLSTVQFPLHVLTPSEELAGAEAARVADGRRSALDYWTGTSTNVEYSLKWTMDRVRASTMLALDRGHNLTRLIYEVSQDNFTTVEPVFDVTLPTATAPGSLDDDFGVRTEEGAWLKRFPLRAAQYGRIRIPAMGAEQKPKIVGLWVGLGYAVDLLRPLSDDQDEARADETTTPAGWRGSGPPGFVRTGTLRLELPDLFEYQRARYHLGPQGHFGRRRPTWVVLDDAEAERALLAIRPVGTLGFAREPRWAFHKADVPFLEHEPLAA
jgi:hypothetical protein